MILGISYLKWWIRNIFYIIYYNSAFVYLVVRLINTLSNSKVSFKIYLYKENMQKIEAYVKAVIDDYDKYQRLPTIDQFVMGFVNNFNFYDSPSSEEREFLKNKLIKAVKYILILFSSHWIKNIVLTNRAHISSSKPRSKSWKWRAIWKQFS